MKSRQEKKHKEHKKNTKIKRAQRTTRCQKVDQMRQEGATLRRMTKNKKKQKRTDVLLCPYQSVQFHPLSHEELSF